MEFQIKNGNVLSIDTKKWLISENPICRVVGQDNENYEIENENGLIAKIPVSIINDNYIEIDNDKLPLTKGVYEYWVVAPERKRASRRFNELFIKNAELIFRNKDVVLSKAEFFLLRPELLTSGSAYIGSCSYPLGALFESITSGSQFYFDEFAGFKKMYLISISGSPLSGRQNSLFWCEEESRIISFGVGKGPGLPKKFLESYRSFYKLVAAVSYIHIDFEDHAIEQLIKELDKKVKI
jgi:hypothetical protein